MRKKMMLAVAACAAVGSVLAACSQAPSGATGASAPAQAAAALPTALPNLFQASYRAEAVVHHGTDQPRPVVMIRSGRKMRMEMTSSRGPSVVIADLDAGQSYMITEAAGQRVAMQMPLTANAGAALNDLWTQTDGLRATGACLVAGQPGVEWSRPAAAAGSTETPVARTACIAPDGVLLRVTENGAPVWETTRLDRGPQDPALFAPPAGVQVIHLGSGAAALAAGALERAKAHR